MIRKRIASVDDSAIYRLIIDQLIPYSKIYRNQRPPSRTSIASRLRSNTTYVIANGRQYPVGFVTMFRQDRTWIVDMLAVASSYQGKGYGKMLMSAAESKGLRSGCEIAQLYVDESNSRAIGFYHSRGYTMQNYLAHLGCYVMMKPLRD